MLKLIKIFIFVFVLKNTSAKSCHNPSDNYVELETSLGKIRGLIECSYLNQTYYSFQGVRYAEPPLGNLRFKSPKPVLPWNGTLEAVKEGNVCAQKFPNQRPFGSEDCLFLNIATPKLPKDSSELLPVMVWIHGGAWMGGSGSFREFNPSNIINDNVILVTINYRLGILGFLRAEDPDLNIPGNAGLKDQVEALRWVQKYIEYFGGDKNKVTIFGQSSGAGSTNLLFLSSKTKGLFHRAIFQSGSGAVPFIVKPKIYDQLLEITKCKVTNKHESLQCLWNKKVDEILEAIDYAKRIEPDRLYQFAGGVVENPAKEDSLLDKPIDEMIKSKQFNQVPVMSGFCSHEMGRFPPFGPFLPDFKDNELLVPEDIKLKKGSKESIELGNKIKKFYYGDSTPSFENEEIFIQISSDRFMVYKIFNIMKKIVENSEIPLYFYNFDIHKIGDRYNKYVTHGDDLRIIFNQRHFDAKMDKTVKTVVKLWTNFAKFGNPTPEIDDLINAKWLPFSKEQLNYLKISDSKLEPLENPAGERMKFWEKVYKEYAGNVVTAPTKL